MLLKHTETLTVAPTTLLLLVLICTVDLLEVLPQLPPRLPQLPPSLPEPPPLRE